MVLLWSLFSLCFKFLCNDSMMQTVMKNKKIDGGGVCYGATANIMVSKLTRYI